MDSFNAGFNIGRRVIAKILRDRVTLVMRSVDEQEAVTPFDTGGERFSEFITFQRELQKIINQRIDEVRRETGKVLNWLTRKRPVGGRSQLAVVFSSVDGDDRFSAYLSGCEVAVRMQTEAVYIDSLKKQGDIETLRRFLGSNSLLASEMIDSEAGVAEILKPSAAINLELPGFPDYFNRPDLFGKLNARPSSEEP